MTPNDTREANVHRLLNPRSVAIIGVSRDPDSFGYPLVAIAQRYGYKRDLYLVNPNADSILGMRCYPSVLDVPADIDAALIMLPKAIAGASVEQCIRKGVGGIVIITAGFAEQGAEGRRLQDHLVAQAARNGTRILGPNTLGYYSAPSRLDLLMSGFISEGPTALLTQSGNLTTSLTFPGAERGLGFSYVVDLGNQADLQSHDFVRYFLQDSATRSIAIHIEGLRDGRGFMKAVREAVPVKPVIALKSGRTETGARVVSSHTASIAGNDEIYKAAFEQCGAIQVESFTEFTSVLLALNQGKTAKGNRMCIISEGGGDCALTGDACIRKGLEVPPLSPATQERLRTIVPVNGSVDNPVDLAGWEHVVAATEIVLDDESIDGVIIVGGFAGFFHISPNDLRKETGYVLRMCEVLAKTPKPVVIYSYFSLRPSPLLDILREHRVPLYVDHHDAVNAMAALVKYDAIRRTMAGRPFHAALPSCAADAATASGPGRSLLEPLAKEMLRRYGLSCPEEKMATDPEDAAAVADAIGYPVALKIVSRDILHKSDAGCVKLGLTTRDDVQRAFGAIVDNARKAYPDAGISGVLVSRMDTEQGVEIIIGGLRDPAFGPVVMFGIGGIWVEVMKDVSFRVCPIDESDADEMVRGIDAFPLLAGLRGKPAADVESIKRALLSVSRLLVENPQIAEIDLNPVKVHAHGLRVLDARVITQEIRAEHRPDAPERTGRDDSADSRPLLSQSISECAPGGMP